MEAEKGSLESELVGILGSERGHFERLFLEGYELATFATYHRVRAVVRPQNTDEVAAVVRCAATHDVALYPVSRGCNWGLGSRVPTSDQAIVLDLSGMDRILSYCAQQGFVRIQAGTTFQQVCDFLRQSESPYYLSVIGGHPSSSILANTIERGDGLGPNGDRSHYVCALEVVLGDGTVLNTGFASFFESSLKNCTQDSIGPGIDGLFFQSNFGIVTAMTVWLKKKPEHFVSGFITFSGAESLLEALPSLRALQEQGVIKGNSLAIWNIYKVLASTGQHPLRGIAAGARAPCLSQEVLQEVLPRGLKKVRWMVSFALYAPTASHIAADCRVLRAMVRPYALRTVFITRRIARIGKMLSGVLSRVFKFDVMRWLNAFYFESAFLGHTTELSIRALYWRKEGEIPKDIDPNRDRCGVLWVCHVVPNLPTAIGEMNRIVTETCLSHGFEPNLALLNTSERLYRMFLVIMYDRLQSGEDTRAMACQAAVQQMLIAAGFPPFRLGLQSMGSVTTKNSAYKTVLTQLKQGFDPQGIIAPGRYDL